MQEKHKRKMKFFRLITRKCIFTCHHTEEIMDGTNYIILYKLRFRATVSFTRFIQNVMTILFYLQKIAQT